MFCNCLNRTSLGLTVMFRIDKYSVYTCQINDEFVELDVKFSLYMILLYSEFDLDKFDCVILFQLLLILLYVCYLPLLCYFISVVAHFIVCLLSPLQAKYNALKRQTEKIEMELTQVHLWQAEALDFNDEDADGR